LHRDFNPVFDRLGRITIEQKAPFQATCRTVPALCPAAA
jgi:hypothetical protein